MGREQPLISVDVVPFRVNPRKGDLEFGLHRRPFDPYADELALPGVLLLPGERVHEAAYRALEAKLEIKRDDVLSMIQTSVHDETNRDPRGATVSIVFVAVIRYREDDGDWLSLWTDEVPHLPFDHNAILTDSFISLGIMLWSDWSVTRSLLGERFTTSSALSLSSALNRHPSAPSNLSRWLGKSGKVERDSDQSGLSGRDTRWRWL